MYYHYKTPTSSKPLKADIDILPTMSHQRWLPENSILSDGVRPWTCLYVYVGICNCFPIVHAKAGFPVMLLITKTCPCNIQRILSALKIEKFIGKCFMFSIILLVEAVLSTHNLCFEQK